MGALANRLRTLIPQFWRSNGSGGLTSAQDARTYEEEVATAIETLEAQATASRWHQGSGAPAPALGQVYDQYLDNDTGDTYEYSAAQGWQRTGNLHGKDGKTPVKGTDYFDGYTPIKGVDYRDGKDGKTPVKGVDYFDGKTPVKGVDYVDGADGSRLYQSSAAPTAADAGKVGDLFYHWLSATQYEVYDYPTAVAAGQNPWRLRFTTPVGTGGGGSSYTLPQADASTLGGIKLGTGLTFNSRTGQVDAAGGSASFPAQSSATTGQYLISSGTAGGEKWGGMKIGFVLEFFNSELQHPQYYARATTLYHIEPDSGVATISYTVNGGASQPVPLTNNAWTGSITFPAKSTVVWNITYNNNYNMGNVDVLGNEVVTP